MIIQSNYHFKPFEKALKTEGIVVHSMSEYLDGVHAPEFIYKQGLSAHAFIHPNGDIELGQSPKLVAYHAGESAWKQFHNLNDHFLGVEVLVKGDLNYSQFLSKIKGDWMTVEQRTSLLELLVSWSLEHKVDSEYIAGHMEVSPGRKFDPGDSVDMNAIRKEVKSKLSERLL